LLALLGSLNGMCSGQSNGRSSQRCLTANKHILPNRQWHDINVNKSVLGTDARRQRGNAHIHARRCRSNWSIYPAHQDHSSKPVKYTFYTRLFVDIWHCFRIKKFKLNVHDSQFSAIIILWGYFIHGLSTSALWHPCTLTLMFKQFWSGATCDSRLLQ